MFNFLSKFFIKNSFSIGSLVVYYYAICIVTGMCACAFCAIWLFKKRGIKADYILDMMIAIVPCAIICARAWYVLLSIGEFINSDTTFFTFMSDVVNVRKGGLAIHGGVMGGALGLIIVAKIRKLELADLFDVGGTLLPLGQAIGRMGNFFNQEVYGKPIGDSSFAISVYIEKTGQRHHALFFYEMIANLILLGLLIWFFKKYNGKTKYYSTSFYLFGYGIIRALLEPLREAEYQMGNLPVPSSVLTSIAFIVIGLTVLTILLRHDIKQKNYWWKEIFKKSKAVSVSDENFTSKGE